MGHSELGWRDPARERLAAGAELPEALLALLAAPDTHARLFHDQAATALVDSATGDRFAISNGIPVLIRTREKGAVNAAEAAGFAARYDEVLQNPRMQALYGDSGYFNVGLWDGRASDLPAACDTMVDRLAEPIAPDAHIVLDIGCGRGAGTARLASLFPEAQVVAVNISIWQLEEARRRGTRLAVASDAARLAFADGVANAVVACESPEHFDTREDFMREAWRVLKPGGTLSVADMLFRDRAPVGEWMLPNDSDPQTADEYAGMLGRAGFESVHAVDETARTWLPFCDLMAKVYGGREEVLKAVRNSLACYVLASARKPGAIED